MVIISLREICWLRFASIEIFSAGIIKIPRWIDIIERKAYFFVLIEPLLPY
jgi:hypothetical protein